VSRLTGLSLRRRLVLGLLAVLAVGIIGFAAVTYTALRAFLQARTDSDAVAAAHAAAVAIRASLGGPALRSGRPPGPRRRIHPLLTAAEGRAVRRALAFALPTGDAADLRVRGRSVVDVQAGPAHLEGPLSSPVLRSLRRFRPGDVDGHVPVLTSIAVDGSRYRVVAVHPRRVPSLLLVAIPTGGSQATLHRLLLIETAAGAGLLLLLGGLALTVVRAGLRPLGAITETAVAITAGERNRRVPVPEDDTEIGRVSRVLNRMLTENEVALADKEASENRLRRFVADASHELRTPLASIRSYADLLASGVADSPADRRTALDRIQSETVRMSRLVEDLLLLARLDSGRPLARDAVDLTELASAAVADARTVQPDRRITLDAGQPVVVRGDADRLHQLLANLLANAWQHTPPGTPVQVRVGTDGASALLAVRDHGPGIPPQALAKIFDRFYRTDPSRHRSPGGAGVGLGLSIVDAIVRAHGGTVQVATPPGGGAEFLVRLPGLDVAGGRAKPETGRLQPVGGAGSGPPDAADGGTGRSP
jgi:two-component system OmpR family sensor kinase